MPDFHVRSDSVNVEQIMEQIRARIREKRGVDYTEQQIREMATAKLEKFLDPRGLRSDLLEQFRRVQREQPPLPNYAFEDSTLYESHRAPLRWIRRLLNPILKLFFNPNPLIQALHIQAQLNTAHAARRHVDQLYYELLHNLVVETTRMGIEVKNLKMRVESLTSRLEFNERRARALESVVVYRPSVDDRGELAGSTPAEAVSAPGSNGMTTGGPGEPGPGQRSRRRRRRRGRRGSGSVAAIMEGANTPAAAESGASESSTADQQHDAGGAENEAASDASPRADSSDSDDL